MIGEKCTICRRVDCRCDIPGCHPPAVWIIKRGTQYNAVWGWTRHGAAATRYLTREHASRVCEAIHGARVIRLRTRPASERLYLAARIAAWEPVVRAAVDFMQQHPEAKGPVADQIRALPEEHRP